MQGLLAGLALLPNSRPLHKQMLSALRPLLERQRDQQGFAALAAARIAEEAALYLREQGGGGSASSEQQQQRALQLGSALASLLASPACKPAMLRCAVPAVAALSAALQAALQPAGLGSSSVGGAQPGEAAAAAATEHITTDVMDGLQDSSEFASAPACVGQARQRWRELRALLSFTGSRAYLFLCHHATPPSSLPLLQSPPSTSSCPPLASRLWRSSRSRPPRLWPPPARLCSRRCRGRRL